VQKGITVHSSHYAAMFPEHAGLVSAVCVRHLNEDTISSRLEDTRIEDTVDLPTQIGKYPILEQIGAGGQASVYRAVHPVLQKEVVVKLSKFPAETSDRAVQEGRLLSQLEHPYVCRVLDLDFHNNRPYMVMPFIHGQTLKSFLQAKSLDANQIMNFMSKLCEAVAAAHALGITHQDIKPNNVLINQHGDPILIDFGLAKVRGAWYANAPVDSVVGTFGFMAPEQARANDAQIGPATDIFGLGALLFYLLTGKPPIKRDGRSELENAQLCSVHWSALEASSAPTELKSVCEKALHPDPEARHQSVQEFIQELRLPVAAPIKVDPAKARVSLRRTITCPHCWHEFPPEDIFWIAEHNSLLGDGKLGDNEYRRFLPSRFDVAGNAIDAGGVVCHELACPRCHLGVPRALLETAPLFLSIIGAPASGKTYFLSAMIQKLRESLPRFFKVSITDSDPNANKVLNQYVEQQFLNPNRNGVVRLAKTEEQGDLYSNVMLGERTVTLPMPFLFSVSPLDSHPNRARRKKVSRVLCLYDNAGESFLPGKDTGQNMVTRHLARSSALMFLFDPTQDTRFRAACRGFSTDPQILEEPVTSRQETILHELAHRVRKHSGLGQNERHKKPLIVVLTKFDAWSDLVEEVPFGLPLRHHTATEDWAALDVHLVESVSQKLRDLMWKFSPELVAAAESFSERVLFVPASSFGQVPQKDEQTGAVGISPDRIDPVWCEVPILWTLANCDGLIPVPNDSQVTPSAAPPRSNAN